MSFSEYSVTVNNVCKSYKKINKASDRFKEWFLPFYKSKTERQQVLKDISFSVRKGESVGIIGMNGAGKSTLLKIITGTASATSGSVRFSGRVAALLELGMGFHPDFTGSDNIMLAGQLMGMSIDEIKKNRQNIEDFAEIGDAFNAPVRTYSSGMQMRLAFALATAIRPDVLIVDEALSVGDAYFQQKCFVRIKEFKREGTSLLFVSHDKSAVLSLCDRAILLNKGEMLLDGNPESVLDYYNLLIADKQALTIDVEETEADNGKFKTSMGTREAEITDIWLENDKGVKTEAVKTGEAVSLKVKINAVKDIDDLVFGFLIKDRTGVEVYGTNTFHTQDPVSVKANGKKDITVSFDMNLGAGIYSISAALHTGKVHVGGTFHWIDLAVTFTVINTEPVEFIGIAYLKPRFSIA